MGVSSRDRKIATQIVGLIQFFISLVQQFIESKSNGIDRILDKVPKISADMIAPSLTKIFKLLLHTSIFVGDWELARQCNRCINLMIEVNVRTIVQFLSFGLLVNSSRKKVFPSLLQETQNK